MFQSGFGSLLLSSNSWGVCYNGYDLNIVLPPVPASSSVSTRLISPAKRPVARALCFDDISEPVTESFEFTAAPTRL